MAEKDANNSKTTKKAASAQVINEAEKSNIELSDTEKSALEVATGEAGNKKYKLSDPKTQYSESDFTLAGDQSKELPEAPSDSLVARIRSGFIVEA